MKVAWDHKLIYAAEYLVVTVTLDDDECLTAAAVTEIASLLAQAIPYAGALVSVVFQSLAEDIISENQGFGVIVTMKIPLVGVGFPSNSVTSRRPAEAMSSVVGTFDAMRASAFDNAQTEEVLSDGWKRILVDLNMGARGKYIYLDVHLHTHAIPVATGLVTGLTIQHGTTKSQPAPAGYVQDPTDLNMGSGGEYIYVSYTKEGKPPLGAVMVFATSDVNEQTQEGWTSTGMDLNKGAGGMYIYLCYSLQSTVQIRWAPYERFLKDPRYLPAVKAIKRAKGGAVVRRLPHRP